MNGLKLSLKTIKKMIVNNQIVFISLIVLWSISLFSIFISNRLYIDDLGRSLHHYDNWTSAGRPVADLLSRLLFMGSHPFNVTPLTQIFALVAISTAAFLIAYIFNTAVTWQSFLFILPMGISPFFLENISYSFDSLWMSLAILTACYPIFIIRLDISSVSRLLLGSISLFLSFCLYQPAVGVFLILTIFAIYVDYIDNKKIFKTIFQLIIMLLIALEAYKLMAIFISFDHYAKEHKEILTSPEIYKSAIANICSYLDILKTDWIWNPIGVLVSVIFIDFIISNCCYILHINSCKKYKKLIITILIIPIALIFSSGPQFLLKNPVFAPRTFLSLSVLVPAVLFAISKTILKYKIVIVNICIALLCLQSALVASTYGFILKNQKQYEDKILYHLTYDIDFLSKKFNFTSIYIKGTIGKTPVIGDTANVYPILNKLNPVHLSDSWDWGVIQLKYICKSLKDIDLISSINTQKMEEMLTNQYYTIYKSDNTIVIVFSEMLSK